MSSLTQRARSRRLPQPAVRVMVACNGDGGVFQGFAEGFTFSCRGESIDLALSGGAAPRFTECAETIRVFRREFKVSSAQSHVGNWCWNEYGLSLNDAARLLHRAISSRKFSIDGASGNNACRLSEALEKHLTVTEIALLFGQFGHREASGGGE